MSLYVSVPVCVGVCMCVFLRYAGAGSYDLCVSPETGSAGSRPGPVSIALIFWAWDLCMCVYSTFFCGNVCVCGFCVLSDLSMRLYPCQLVRLQTAHVLCVLKCVFVQGMFGRVCVCV